MAYANAPHCALVLTLRVRAVRVMRRSRRRLRSTHPPLRSWAGLHRPCTGRSSCPTAPASSGLSLCVSLCVDHCPPSWTRRCAAPRSLLPPCVDGRPVPLCGVWLLRAASLQGCRFQHLLGLCAFLRLTSRVVFFASCGQCHTNIAVPAAGGPNCTVRACCSLAASPLPASRFLSSVVRRWRC